MSSQQTDNLRKFKYVTKLDFPGSKEEIYRLLYPHTVRYLRIGTETTQLLDGSGRLRTSTQINSLQRKVRAYTRIAGNGIDTERLGRFLRIDEAHYLLTDLAINSPSLEEKLYRRLRRHIDYQVENGFYRPLLLGQLLEQSEFVTEYMQTNIGHPDQSENYFNKLREMIQQINEQTEYVKVRSYFDVLRTLLEFVNKRDITTSNIIVRTYRNYCILVAGTRTTQSKYYHFFRQHKQPSRDNHTTIIDIDNNDITELMQIYNRLRSDV